MIFEFWTDIVILIDSGLYSLLHYEKGAICSRICFGFGFVSVRFSVGVGVGLTHCRPAFEN